MTHSHDASRRRALQLVAGAPLWPIASTFAAASFVTPAMAMQEVRRVPRSATFHAMAAPTLAAPEQMATTYCASSVTTTYDKGLPRTFTLGYETFFLTGQQVPRTNGGHILAGGYVDIHGRPIRDRSDPDRRPFFSDCPDGMSLIQLPNARVEGVKGLPVFAVVQFEYTTRNKAGDSMDGLLPSPIAVLTLDQDPASGRLSLVSYFNVDTSAANGLWITCGASRSPWNTHLSSEEYEPDATALDSDFAAYSKNLYGDPKKANPYHYGHLPEVTVQPDGTGTLTKHYCLGRISHELVQVMPDERTVLMGDDFSNGGLFLFVADRPRDLSAGTLYVAKWYQTSSVNGGSADLGWIRLGHATSDEIRILADTLSAADIVDVKTKDPKDSTYTAIPYDGETNWVKFKPGQEQAAAFLETHRYAAYIGGSLGFTKLEGTTVNAKDKIAYSAISYVRTEMTDGSGGIAIEGPDAGMVYAWPLAGGQFDNQGQAIESDWVPISGAPVAELIGEDLATPDALGNFSNPDKIANPDNLKFSERMRTLFIGEDSGGHVNNFLWAFNVETKLLSRLLSCPSGAESTGLHAVDDINGYAYIMSNFQHPGDWDLTFNHNGHVTGGLHEKVFATLDPIESANYNGKYSAAVGYLALTGQVR